MTNYELRMTNGERMRKVRALSRNAAARLENKEQMLLYYETGKMLSEKIAAEKWRKVFIDLRSKFVSIQLYVMNIEARKIQLIKDLLEVESDTVLSKLEKVLVQTKSKRKLSAHDFVGVINKDDADSMIKAIEEGCEQIHPDDWK